MLNVDVNVDVHFDIDVNIDFHILVNSDIELYHRAALPDGR